MEEDFSWNRAGQKLSYRSRRLDVHGTCVAGDSLPFHDGLKGGPKRPWEFDGRQHVSCGMFRELDAEPMVTLVVISYIYNTIYNIIESK